METREDYTMSIKTVRMHGRTHVVMQAWHSGNAAGAYMVATECGSTLYPRHWNDELTILPAPRATVSCDACRAVVRCCEVSCNAILTGYGVCPSCDPEDIKR